MVPTNLVRAVQEHGWLALALTPDAALASGPDAALQLLDGLIVSDRGEDGDRDAGFSRTLEDAAEARGLPVLRLPGSLGAQDTALAVYAHAIADLFVREVRAGSGAPS